MLKWILTGLTLSFSLSLHAEPTKTCIPQSEMQQIGRDFEQFKEYSNREFCLDGSEISNLLEALVFMKLTPFEPSMPVSNDELFSGRFQNDWYGYFTQRIKSIEIDRGCPKGVGAYVYGFYSDVMYVCTMMLTKDFTGLDRASVFMHEARHMDGFPHTTCSHGPRANVRGACDRSIGDGGSYAVSVETYAQLAKYAPGLHPALKSYAQASAITYSDEAFENPVRIDRSPALLVMGQDRSFHKLSMEGSELKVEAQGSSPTLGRIAMRASLMILFPEDKNLTAGYLFTKDAGEIQQQAGTLANEYNAMTPDQRAQVLDTHNGPGWTVQVKGNILEFMCDRRSDAKQTLNFSGQALGFVYPDGYSRSNPSTLLALADGRHLEVSCVNLVPAIRESSFALNTPMKRLYKSGNLSFGIGADNQLYTVQGNVAEPVSVPGVESAFEIAPIESFKFF